jgi:hypothetical protein
LVADVVLSQRADGESNRVADGCVEFGRESLEFFVGADVDPNARALHANQHTSTRTTSSRVLDSAVSLVAITAMLGHKSMRMTLVYARIADRTVADQYYAAANQIDAMYENP